MSIKPTIALARWADLVGSFVTDAPSGLRDTGFLDGTPAEVDIVNAELKQLYLWALWLSDGDVAFHNLSVSHNMDCPVGCPATFGDVVNLANRVNFGVSVNPTFIDQFGGATFGSAVAFNNAVSFATLVSVSGTLGMGTGSSWNGVRVYTSPSGTSLATGNNNNYTLPNAAVVRLSAAAGAAVLTGMIAVAGGHQVTIVNPGATSYTITHQDAGSSSANRFTLPGGTTLTMAQNAVATFLYDSNSPATWRLHSKNF